MNVADQRFVRCVGALVYHADGRLLLIRRGNPPGRGFWSLPGGRVEPGENDAEAVVREVAEETGLIVTPGELCGSVHRPGVGVGYVIYDYRCAVRGGNPAAASDATGLRWVCAAEFAALHRSAALVDQLAETLTAWQALPGR